MVQTIETVSPLQVAEMEVEGCNWRVELALRALRGFYQRHTIFVGAKRHWMTDDISSVALLEAQEFELVREYDEARRCQSKAIGDRNFLLPPRSCIAPGPARR